MQFVDDRKLARRFRENEVSELERFFYFLIYLAGTSSMFWLANHYPTSTNNWDIAIDANSFVITVIALFLMFKANSNGDNRDFIPRYVCLSLPVGVQTVVLGILMIFGVYMIADITGLSVTKDGSSISDFLVIGAIQLFFCHRLYGAVKIAAAADEYQV